MKEFSTVSAEQLNQIAGGFAHCAPFVYLSYQVFTSGDGNAEVLPGFNKFLAETQRIAGKA
jgi:hypothetical protein